MGTTAPAPYGGRLRSACDRCRQRKIRCDRAKPACEACHFASTPCIFTPLPIQPRKSVREQLQDTRAEVRRLEEALRAERGLRQSSNPSLHESSGLVNDLFDSRGFDVTLKAFRWHLAYCTPGFAASIQSDPAFDLEELFDRVADSFDLQFRTKPARVVLPKWPPRRLIDASLEYFTSNGLYSIHPVVDTDALTCLLDAPDFDGYGIGANIADRACLAALTAMITRIRRQEPAFADADPDAYVQAVLSVLPQLMMEHTNVRALEALVILALYIAPLGQPQTAEILLAMAVRILFNLGAHRARPTYENSAHKHQHQHLRALFWTFYAVDKEMSLRKCQPPMINDADCDLTLPDKYVAQSSEHQFFTSELSPKELLYPSDLRLAMLKSRVYHLLYSEQSLSHSRASRLQLIRELDQELNDLKSQFPSACKPDAVVSGSVPDYLIHDLSLRGVNVHLEYYHCLSKIHGASAIGTPALQSLSPPSTSMELCYQAARSTLIYLRRIRHLIFPETFWIYAQILLTSSISLYMRILSAPKQCGVQDDMHLLESTIDVFHQLNCVEPSKRFPPFVIIEAFIQRLTLLAEQSVSEAAN